MNSEKKAITGIDVRRTLTSMTLLCKQIGTNPGQHLQVSVTGEGRMAGNHNCKLDPNQEEQEGSNVAKQLTVNRIPKKFRVKIKRMLLTGLEERALG